MPVLMPQVVNKAPNFDPHRLPTLTSICDEHSGDAAPAVSSVLAGSFEPDQAVKPCANSRAPAALKARRAEASQEIMTLNVSQVRHWITVGDHTPRGGVESLATTPEPGSA